MSMEMWVLSDRELSSVAEWQAAIEAEGYPLRLDSTVQLQTHSGFLPAHLREKRTGFECDHFPADEFLSDMKQQNPDVDFGRDWKFVLAFRWGGSFNELEAASMAAAAYAAATDGVVVDDQEMKIRSAGEARQNTHDLVRGLQGMAN
jgi:hypothetical protein